MRPIRVLPRLAAERLDPAPGEVCISITNPRQSPARLENWSDLLRLGFHDIDEPAGDYTAMSRQQARELLDFLHAHRHDPLTVHCEYGFSRSVAAGLFAAAWRGQELDVEVVNPNPWVTLQLCRVGWRRALQWKDWALLKVSLLGPWAVYQRQCRARQPRSPVA